MLHHRHHMVNVDNSVLIQRLDTLAAECLDTASVYKYTALAPDLVAMHDSLKFLSLSITENVIGLANWPDVAYAFIKATEKNLPIIYQQLTKESL